MDTASPSDLRTDAELVAAANGGDQAAFEVLYYRYRDWVVQLAYRWTGDRELAMDVLQETFFSLAKKFPGFRLNAKLQTYLYPVIRNLSVTALRKSSRYRSDSEASVEIDNTAAPSVESGDEVVHKALADLGLEHRDVLLLRFIDGLSLAEIADVLGIPLGTVKSRLHNALERLRQDSRTKDLFQK